MIKAVSTTWDFGEPQTSIIPVCSYGCDRTWMSKQADCFDRRDLEDLKIEKGHQGLKVIALGDYEYIGHNANGDAFTEKGGSFRAKNGKPIEIKVGNVQTHPTFVTHGRVYRNHKNDDPKYSFGPVLKSAHNDRMKRVELIVSVPEDVFADDLQKLANGDSLGWSMACRIRGDFCSTCANFATKKAEYCNHVRDHLTDIDDSGHPVFLYNDGMTYFDISRVFRPADRIALTLKKVAHIEKLGSATLAEQLGIKVPSWMISADNVQHASNAIFKLATKLADIEKTMPAASIFAVNQEPLDLSGMSRSSIFDSLVDQKINPPLVDFIELVTGDRPTDEQANEAQNLMPGIFGRAIQDGSWAELSPGSDVKTASRNLVSAADACKLHKVAERYSLDEPYVCRRAIVSAVRSEVNSKQQKTAQKSLSTDSVIVKMAIAYAGFQLNMIAKHPDDAFLAKRVVSQNFGVTSL